MPAQELASTAREVNGIGHLQQGENQPTPGKGQMISPFLKKKQKRNIILDEGEGNIPFSATREFYKYEAFVTNLRSDARIDAIKGHLVRKLGTDDVFIKQMSKSSAPYLSLGVSVGLRGVI